MVRGGEAEVDSGQAEEDSAAEMEGEEGRGVDGEWNGEKKDDREIQQRWGVKVGEEEA